jgi:hypothetical protein
MTKSHRTKVVDLAKSVAHNSVRFSIGHTVRLLYSRIQILKNNIKYSHLKHFLEGFEITIVVF